jgi:hypothetical protein
MFLEIRMNFSFFLILFSLTTASLLNGEFLQGKAIENSFHKLTVNDCLLPDDHPLQKKLKTLFKFGNDGMFRSRKHLRQAGFQVLNRIHRGLMVASHPSLKQYLIKKFQNKISQKDQLNNYLSRINGARALRAFTEVNNLKHIVVPQKWLYRLPKRYSNPETKERSYILIVEKIDICSGGEDFDGEVARRYHNIDLEVLREICVILYYFRGLDSRLHNLPFTHLGKIAFIDTERWERERQEFLANILPFLSYDRQAFALGVLQELQVQ